MAKVPSQFQKKAAAAGIDTRSSKSTVQPDGSKPSISSHRGSPQNRTPVDAPNAAQDEALAVTRNALTGSKKTSPKGMSKGKPNC